MPKLQTITEGSAMIKIAKAEKVSKEMPVFYNPVMKLNKDISILLLNSIDKKQMQIALPLAGTGVRGIRFLKELSKGKVKGIYFNDYDKKAFNAIRDNLRLNKIKFKKSKPEISITNKDANMFMLESKGFDYIDIDPFGCPNKFLNAAISRLARNGILAVTATDTAPLCGTYPSACLRKYWAKPLRNELMHELGLRILVRKIQLVAAQYDKALTPIFSYFRDHYFRIFFVADKGRKKADELFKEFGFLVYCDKCMERRVVFDIFNDARCNCGGMFDYAGPLFIGKLFDSDLVDRMFNKIKDNKELYNFLNIIKDEARLDVVGFYDLHKLCKEYRLNIPKLELLIDKIKKTNKAARTHFSGVGVKSDVKVKELVEMIKNC